jgi:hypothetical protein
MSAESTMFLWSKVFPGHRGLLLVFHNVAKYRSAAELFSICLGNKWPSGRRGCSTEELVCSHSVPGNKHGERGRERPWDVPVVGSLRQPVTAWGLIAVRPQSCCDTNVPHQEWSVETPDCWAHGTVQHSGHAVCWGPQHSEGPLQIRGQASYLGVSIQPETELWSADMLIVFQTEQAWEPSLHPVLFLSPSHSPPPLISVYNPHPKLCWSLFCTAAVCIGVCRHQLQVLKITRAFHPGMSH